MIMAMNNEYKTELAPENNQFLVGEYKIKSVEEKVGTKKEIVPLSIEAINMMEGLADEEVNQYLEENPKIVSLFEIDIAEIITLYIGKRRDRLKRRITRAKSDSTS
mgnify:CR=1 FL=1